MKAIPWGVRSTRTSRKLWALAAVLAGTVGLVALATNSSGAYFSDTAMGTIMLSVATPSPTPRPPCHLEPGRSRARHWEESDRGWHWWPIAWYDASENLCLDFGEMRQGSRKSWPDVLRLTSLIETPQRVTFCISGALAPCVTSVHLAGHGGGALRVGATASVAMTIDLPRSLKPGMYTGRLTIHIAGWSPDARLPMVVRVSRQRGRHEISRIKVEPTVPAATPTITPAATPSISATSGVSTPSPSATPAPAVSATPSAVATPSAGGTGA